MAIFCDGYRYHAMPGEVRSRLGDDIGSAQAWANPPVPCLHSDPKFPDCPPGETRRLNGSLWFYEGSAISNELRRLEPFHGSNQ